MALKNTQNRTIVLPIPEKKYEVFLTDNKSAHEIIENYYSEMPECFPIEMSKGYHLNGRTRLSKKMNIQMRKIKLGNISYRIRPSFILPYQRGKTDEATKGLFLLGFGVPFWALAFLLGHNPMWWYRLYLSFGRYSLVGTSIRDPQLLPKDILADEHHTKQNGKKVYIATTIGKNCFLGIAASTNVDEESLERAYNEFKKEALDLNSDYQPDTTNTDGWAATKKAWKNLFPSTIIIECFLHAFLKVRNKATKDLKEDFDKAGDKIWNSYRANSKGELSQQIRRLSEWANKLSPSAMKENILKICKKKDSWIKHLDYPKAHRTSNMLDRLMRSMNKHAFNSQKFHGKDIQRTTDNFKAFALLHNFRPSHPSVWKNPLNFDSPAARLNGFTYHEDWLHNLFVSTSLGGFRNHRKPL